MSISRRTLKSGVQYTLRIDDPKTGQRVNLGEYGSRAEAEDAAIAAFNRYAVTGQLVPLRDTPLGKFIDDVYLPSLSVQQSTRDDYILACNHIRSWAYGPDKRHTWEGRSLGDVSHGEVMRFIAAFQTGPPRRSNNYTRKVAQRVRHIFNVAVAEGYVEASDHPYRHDGAKANRLPQRPVLDSQCALTHAAVDTMLAILRRESDQSTRWGREAGFWYHLILAATWSGLRVSELLGLRAAGLRPDPSTIHVADQWAWNAGAVSAKARFKAPKSRYGRRDVPVPDAVFAEIWAWATTVRREGSPDELVFPRPLLEGGWGYWGSSSYFHRRFQDMQNRVWGLYETELSEKGWENPHPRSQMMQNFHEFRHLWASICIVEKNLDLISVSRWAGHHSPAFTAEVYAGLLREVHDEAAKKMRAVGLPQQSDIL